MVENKMPNFLMVGAPKAGTTSIAKYLGEHPDIYISKEKEPFYFLPNILKETNPKDPMYGAIKERAHLDKTSYLKLFEGATTEKMRGEATVHYLYHYEEVIPRVKKELGDIKIIIVLRNPVMRAFSNYKFQSRGQFNSFEDALKLEKKRKQNKYNSFWYYKGVGLYYEPVKAYIENFSRVKVVFFEDFKNNAVCFMQDVYNFLGVDKQFIPNTETQYNPTIVPKNKILHYLYYFKHKKRIHLPLSQNIKRKLNKIIFKRNEEEMSPKTFEYLKNYFTEDIIKLEKLLCKDLSHWYE